MFDDPEIVKLIIIALIGIIVVLTIAVIFLAVKKNTYYVDEDGDEIESFSRVKTRPSEPENTYVPPVTVEPEVPQSTISVGNTPLTDFDFDDDDDEPEALAVPRMETRTEIVSVDVTVKVNDETDSHAITQFPCLMGRDPGCDLVISEPAVSRRHAQLSVVNGALYLEDVSGHNGTYVNGIKLPSLGKARVNVDDVISLGRAEIVIVNIRH